MPSLNVPVQRLKVAIVPLDLPCSGLVTHSGEILTTGKSHGKKSDRFSLNDNMDVVIRPIIIIIIWMFLVTGLFLQVDMKSVTQLLFNYMLYSRSKDLFT